MNARIGLLQIHAAALLAGATGLFGKFLPVAPEAITAGRTLFAVAALLLAAAVFKTPLRLPRWAEALPLLVAGGMLAGHWYCFFQSIQVSSVAIGVLAFSSFPCFVALLEPLAFREPWQPRDLAAVGSVVVGLYVITPAIDWSNRQTQGVLWGVLSGLAYAIFSLLSRRQVLRQPALAVALYQQSAAALFSTPFAWGALRGLTLRDLGLLALLGVAFTALLQGLLVSSLRHLRAQTAAIIIGLEPVYGIALAALLLHERPALPTYAGGALICLAAVLSSLKT